MYLSDYRRLGRESLTGNWGLSIAVALVASLLGGLVSGGSGSSINIDSDDINKLNTLGMQSFVQFLLTWSTISALLSFVIGGTVDLGHCTFLLHQYDKEYPAFSNLFSQFHRLGAGFCLRFLTGLYTFLWSLLLIIPGIMASYSYAMAPFILAERPDYTATDALSESKKLMYGHRSELFCLDLTFIGWSLLCVLTLGIGALWLNPYIAATRAAFYRNLRPKSNIISER